MSLPYKVIMACYNISVAFRCVTYFTIYILATFAAWCWTSTTLQKVYWSFFVAKNNIETVRLNSTISLWL